MSHLLQMRGLKQLEITLISINITSHLLQMRGLKPKNEHGYETLRKVASFTDAWIETVKPEGLSTQNTVASFTDAWIETRPESTV